MRCRLTRLCAALALALGAGSTSAQTAPVCKVLFHGAGLGAAYQALYNNGVEITTTGDVYYFSTPANLANLNTYDAIWTQYGISGTNVSTLTQPFADFLRSGRSIHFADDVSNYNELEQTMANVMAQVLKPSLGTLTFSPTSYNGTLNSGVVGNVTGQPFAPPTAALALDNGRSVNAPARNLVAGAGVMAAFDEADMQATTTGRVSFFGDTGTLSQQATQTNEYMLRNLQAFLLDLRNCQAPMLAANDSGSVTAATGGQAIADVLVNDQIKTAQAGPPASAMVPAVTATGDRSYVRISEMPGSNTSPATHLMTLDTNTGAVDVPAGTPPGIYSLQYNLCQVSKPSNCKQATVQVTVTAGPASQLAFTQAVNQHPVGNTHEVVATVTDAQGFPVAGATVDFMVTAGPNAGQTASATTDANGQARFSYVGGPNAGSDTISASANPGSLTAPALQVQWTVTPPPPPPPPPAPNVQPVPGLSGLGMLGLGSWVAVLGLRRRRAEARRS